jgi:hypothetical protein
MESLGEKLCEVDRCTLDVFSDQVANVVTLRLLTVWLLEQNILKNKSGACCLPSVHRTVSDSIFRRFRSALLMAAVIVMRKKIQLLVCLALSIIGSSLRRISRVSRCISSSVSRGGKLTTLMGFTGSHETEADLLKRKKDEKILRDDRELQQRCRVWEDEDKRERWQLEGLQEKVSV